MVLTSCSHSASTDGETLGYAHGFLAAFYRTASADQEHRQVRECVHPRRRGLCGTRLSPSGGVGGDA